MKYLLIQKTLFLIMILTCNTSIGQGLKDLKWKSRILIVKTLKDDLKKINDQLNEFKNSNEAFNERKLILIVMNKDDFSIINPLALKLDNTEKLLENITKNVVDQSTFFEVILIGLDGGIKLRQSKIISEEDLFKIIDTMPMRKNEIRN